MTQTNTASSSLITRLSPAKVNLFLHITGKRDDGYHNLQTVFRLLDWGDYLHFLPLEPIGLSDAPNNTDETQNNVSETQQAATLCEQLLTLTGANNITDDLVDNLIFKAAKSLLSYAIDVKKLPKYLHKVSITLDKNLPMGAGLGGGSSNAAITLLVLNELWQLGFNHQQLRTIGRTLGADVPIFIYGQDAIAMNIGDELTPIDLPPQHYLILNPNTHIDTAKLFAHPKLRRDITPLSIQTIQSQLDKYTQHLSAPYHNVFTPVVTSLDPAVDEALHYLQSLEAKALGTARMTGSGSAVFLPLDESVTNNTELLATWIENAPCPAYVAEGL